MQDKNQMIPVVLTVTLLLGVGSLVAATPISCGMIIDTPGQYHLTGDLVCDSGVKVAAHDVSINMNGHALIGPGAGPGVDSGIKTSDGTRCVAVKGLNIKGGTITGFGSGIELCESMNAHVSAMTLTRNNIGIELFYSNGNQIDGNDISGNGGAGHSSYGVLLNHSRDNRIDSNKVNGNTSMNINCGGFNVTGSSNNSITSNEISANVMTSRVVGGHIHAGFGIRLREGSNGNTVSGNTLNGNSTGFNSHNSSNNRIQSNTVKDSEEVGFRISGRSINNAVASNTASGNRFFDLFDSQPDCSGTTWKTNNFATRNRSCIQSKAPKP